jgi:hypothetical protein
MDISFLNRKNFKALDFLKSDTATKNNVLNIPTAYYMQVTLNNLAVTASKIQEIRDLLSQPIHITSGFRCIELNKLVGGASSSQHITGEAIDFICPKFGNPDKIVRFLREKNIEVDQCIIEKSGSKEWVHLSIKKFKNRNEFAIIDNNKWFLLTKTN